MDNVEGAGEDDDLEDVDNDGIITFHDLNHGANLSKLDSSGSPLLKDTPEIINIEDEFIDAVDLADLNAGTVPEAVRYLLANETPNGWSGSERLHLSPTAFVQGLGGSTYQVIDLPHVFQVAYDSVFEEIDIYAPHISAADFNGTDLGDLDNGVISTNIDDGFLDNGIDLDANAEVKTVIVGQQWRVIDGQHAYALLLDGGDLHIVGSRITPSDLLADSRWNNSIDDDARFRFCVETGTGDVYESNSCNAGDNHPAPIMADLNDSGNDSGAESDLFGWNFAPIDFDAAGEPEDPNEIGDNDTDADGTHGTTVARIIADSAGDGDRMGLAPRISILPVRVDLSGNLSGNTPHQWKAAIDYIGSLKDGGGWNNSEQNIVAVNASLRLRVKDENSDDPAYLNTHVANSVVEDLVNKDIAYVDSAGNVRQDMVWTIQPNGGSNLTTLPTWQSVDSGAATVDGGIGEWDADDTADRYYHSAGAVVVAATEQSLAVLPDGLWANNATTGSNTGFTGSPAEHIFEQVREYDQLNQTNLLNTVFPPDNPATSVDERLDFIEQHYPMPDGPIDAAFGDSDPDWTIHGPDIAAPGEAVIVGSGTSNAAPMVTATIALVKSLIPSMPITSRADIGETITPGLCAAPDIGVVEHVLCSASYISEIDADVDGGRFLDVFAALSSAHTAAIAAQMAAGPTAMRDLNFDGTVNGRDIDLMWGISRYFEQDPSNAADDIAASSFILARFDVNGDGVISWDQVEENGEQVISGDIGHFVYTVMDSTFGDSNHDGMFNSGDFVVVFQSAEYEDWIDGNSGWDEGDWNGDGDFSTSDFVFAFTVGDYQNP